MKKQKNQRHSGRHLHSHQLQGVVQQPTITAAAALTATSASRHLRKPSATRNAELDIQWSGGLVGTTAVVARPCNVRHSS